VTLKRVGEAGPKVDESMEGREISVVPKARSGSEERKDLQSGGKRIFRWEKDTAKNVGEKKKKSKRVPSKDLRL